MASGVISGALVAYAVDLDPGKATAFILITTACSLLPDMDHPNAMLPRMFMWPGRAIAVLIDAIFGHRTLTHSVLGVGLLSAGMAFIPHFPPHCYAAVILGCVTHILGDMLTVSGVPVFWPHQRDFRISRMRTGGQFEMLLMQPLLILGAAASCVLVVVAGG